MSLGTSCLWPARTGTPLFSASWLPMRWVALRHYVVSSPLYSAQDQATMQWRTQLSEVRRQDKSFHLCSCLFRHPVRLAKVTHTRGLHSSRRQQKRSFEAMHSFSRMQFILGRNFLIFWNCISQLTLHGDQSDSHLMTMLLAAQRDYQIAVSYFFHLFQLSCRIFCEPKTYSDAFPGKEYRLYHHSWEQSFIIYFTFWEFPTWVGTFLQHFYPILSPSNSSYVPHSHTNSRPLLSFGYLYVHT